MQSRVAFAVAAVLAAVAADAQQPAAPGPTPSAAAADELEQVVITGTRFADRTRLDTLAPVDVVSAQALASQGTTELATSLSRIAPSLNFPRPAVTDGTDVIRPATLRGLAPDQTLVLVNSKRRHPSALVNVNGSIGRGSAAVDLNAIPLAAIDRIEVLREGASAQYGSDAIAGVINIRLREAREGGGATVSYGQYDTQVVTARNSRSASDGGTLTASVWAGLPLGAEGFATLTAEYRDRDPTSRGDIDPRDPRTAADIAAGVPRPTLGVTSRFGDPTVKDKTLYLNAGLPLGEWEGYGWAGYQNRKGSSAATPRLRNNVNNLFNGVPRYADGWLPFITSDIDDIAAGIGTKGKLGGWDADFSLVYGRNKLDYGVENTLNGAQLATQSSFDAGSLRYDQLVLNAGITRAFEWVGVKPTNLAVGLEARREGYGIGAGEFASYAPLPGPVPSGYRAIAGGVAPGAQGFPGFRPQNATDKNRTAAGLYGEAEAQLTDKFGASLAARAEHYSDFGNNVTGKLSARYDFTESFALRGTVSTGFRAPGLQQAFFTSTATNFISGIPREVSTLPASDPISQRLGARPLDPEKSKNFSIGAVYRAGRFEATIDAYRIDITDRIVLSENLGGNAAIDALLAGTGVDRVRFFINGVDTKTQGVDLVTSWRLDTDSAGRFAFTLAANYNQTSVEKLPTTNVIPTGGLLFGRVNVLTFEEGTPRHKESLSVEWSLPMGFGELGAGLKATNYGRTVEPQAPATPVVPDVVMGQATVVDLELRAKVGKSFSVALGADNILDKYPTAVPPAANTNGLLGFSRYAPFGFNGRMVYGRAAWNW
jgi:iron complex outermembrane receptor protein